MVPKLQSDGSNRNDPAKFGHNKRVLLVSKRVTSAIHRRALALRGVDADEEEEEKEEEVEDEDEMLSLKIAD